MLPPAQDRLPVDETRQAHACMASPERHVLARWLAREDFSQRLTQSQASTNHKLLQVTSKVHAAGWAGCIGGTVSHRLMVSNRVIPSAGLQPKLNLLDQLLCLRRERTSFPSWASLSQ